VRKLRLVVSFFIVVMAASLFPSMASASILDQGNIPYALPYTSGGCTYDKVLAVKYDQYGGVALFFYYGCSGYEQNIYYDLNYAGGTITRVPISGVMKTTILTCWDNVPANCQVNNQVTGYTQREDPSNNYISINSVVYYTNSYMYLSDRYAGGTVISQPSQLTVAIEPASAVPGSVVSSPSGISCGTSSETCQGNFSGNVTLEAIAADGWSFGYWSDGINQSTDNPVVVTMGGAKTVTAVFQPVLKWPLTGTFASRTPGWTFGTTWTYGQCPSGTYKKHAGIDVNATADEAVYAAHDGVVKAIHYDSPWAYAIVIESNDGSFTTVNWHVNAYGNLAVNDTVTKGQQIGTVANLGGNTHFHFGIRIGAYSDPESYAGALPVANGCEYLAYPENFINPALVNYQ
jgi:hypothetical protein